MRIVKERMSQQDVYNLLQKYDNTFNPPLSAELNLRDYAAKLSLHAEFILCKDLDDVIAFIAYYKNEIIKQLYIPLICVSLSKQKKGIGSKMLNKLINDNKANFTTVALEVLKTNVSAFNFYVAHGFKNQEDRGNKTLMVKRIS